MAKIFLTLTLLFLASAFPLTPQDPTDFFTGFITGLELDPSTTSACSINIQFLESAIFKLSKDAIDWVNMDGYFIKIITDYEYLIQTSPPLSSDCNLNLFFPAFFRVLTPSGLSNVIKNYFKNIKQVTLALQGFESCGKNYRECGIYAGEVFRYMFGFSLNAPKNEFLLLGFEEYEDFVIGFWKGVQNNPAEHSHCKNSILQVREQMEKLGNDLEMFFEGKPGVVIEGFKDLNVMMGKIMSFVNLCNIGGLFEKFIGGEWVITIWGNYEENQEEIRKHFEVVKRYEDDVIECGEAFGNVFKLVVGWSI